MFGQAIINSEISAGFELLTCMVSKAFNSFSLEFQRKAKITFLP